MPWLYAFAIFTIFRLFAYLFFSIVNDLIFAYNILMCLLWTVFLAISIYGWILIYSLYIELSDLTRLEDLAHLRVSNPILLKLLVCVNNKFSHACVDNWTLQFRWERYLPRNQTNYFFLVDGNHAISECIDSPLPGGLSSDDTPQYGFDDASGMSYYGVPHSMSFGTEATTATVSTIS